MLLNLKKLGKVKASRAFFVYLSYELIRRCVDSFQVPVGYKLALLRVRELIHFQNEASLFMQYSGLELKVQGCALLNSTVSTEILFGAVGFTKQFCWLEVCLFFLF